MLVHPVIPVSPETSARAGMKGLLRLGVPVTACVCSLRQGQKGGLLMQKINSEIMNTVKIHNVHSGKTGCSFWRILRGRNSSDRFEND